jgi:predicted nucleotidyltransferase
MSKRASRIQRLIVNPYEHLSSDERRALDSFVRQLLDELESEIVDVRLFGSKARGDAGPESDVDVLVLVHDPAYSIKHRILWMAAESSLEHGVLLSPRIIPPAAWEEMEQADTLFYRTIRTESIPLLIPA